MAQSDYVVAKLGFAGICHGFFVCLVGFLVVCFFFLNLNTQSLVLVKVVS